MMSAACFDVSELRLHLPAGADFFQALYSTQSDIVLEVWIIGEESQL